MILTLILGVVLILSLIMGLKLSIIDVIVAQRVVVSSLIHA